MVPSELLCCFGIVSPRNWWTGVSVSTPMIGVLPTSLSKVHSAPSFGTLDDLKISHIDSNAVDKVIGLLRDEFGQEGPLTVTHGKIHDYLGMTLDFSVPQKVQIQMYDFIDKMLADLPVDMDGTAQTPAADHLSTVNPTPKPLPEETTIMFHHNVAKLLFLCKQARPDLQTAVAFLSTQVKSPDEDDYKKLTQFMRYLHSTARLPLTLEEDNLQVIKWWINGALLHTPKCGVTLVACCPLARVQCMGIRHDKN